MSAQCHNEGKRGGVPAGSRAGIGGRERGEIGAKGVEGEGGGEKPEPDVAEELRGRAAGKGSGSGVGGRRDVANGLRVEEIGNRKKRRSDDECEYEREARSMPCPHR